MSTKLADATKVGRSREASRERFVQPEFRTASGEESHELRVKMPGVDRTGVEISLIDDQLVIVGRRTDAVPESWRPVFREISPFDYRLRVRLNIEVDSERIGAHVEDGILSLTLPVREEAKPRVIEIS